MYSYIGFLLITSILLYVSFALQQTKKKVNPEQPKLPKEPIPVDSRFRSLFLSQLSGVESFRYLKRVPYVDRTILTNWLSPLPPLSVLKASKGKRAWNRGCVICAQKHSNRVLTNQRQDMSVSRMTPSEYNFLVKLMKRTDLNAALGYLRSKVCHTYSERCLLLGRMCSWNFEKSSHLHKYFLVIELFPWVESKT